MSTPLIIGSIVIICICCCISLCSSLVSGSYVWSQSSLDSQVKSDPNILHMDPSMFGQCPTDWRKKVYTNGTQCVKPNVFTIVDDKNNYVIFKQGTCTKGYVESSTVALRTDPNKKYFCGTS